MPRSQATIRRYAPWPAGADRALRPPPHQAEVRLSATEAADFVRALREWPLVEMDADLVSAALTLAEREEMSPWDAANLEAARRADCTRVLSEALPAGRTYEGVRVENPFG